MLFIDPGRAVVFHYGNWSVKLQGITSTNFSDEFIWLSLCLNRIDDESPILSSIDNMKQLEIYLSYLNDTLFHTESGKIADFTRNCDELFIL